MTEVWRPSVNGIVTRLSMTVAALREAGHDVLVIAPSSDGDFHGATVRTVPALRAGFLYDHHPWGLPVPRVARHLADFEPDLVHVVSPILLGIAGVVAARRLRRPLVCSYHTDFSRYARYYRLGWASTLVWSALRRLHGAAAINLVTSRTAADELAGHGIRDIALWPRGVELDRFRPARPGRVRDAGPVRALYVGRVAQEKSLDSLEPLVRSPHLQLTIVGDGPYRAELHRRWDSDRVVFRGTLGGDDLAAAYAAADVFVFPSVTETLGLVLLEALAAGLPVVAADSPASRELLGACPAARLWPTGRQDQIPTLVQELLASAGPEALAATARSEVQRDTWATATESLLAHYVAARGDHPGQDHSVSTDNGMGNVRRNGLCAP